MSTRFPSRRSGFTLIEVMFAIVILAVTMTFVASTLYFGIHQTVSTNDESIAAETARSAVNLLEKVMTANNAPSTGGAFSVLDGTPELTAAVSGEMIAKTDPRFAWTAIYRREGTTGLATVYVFVVKAQTGGRYTSDDLQSYDNTSVYPPALTPKAVSIQLTDGGTTGPDLIQIGDPGDPLAAAAAPDAYVVISSPGADGSTAGRIYRLGTLVNPKTHTFQLPPGSELRGPSENLIGTGLLVGRPYNDPTKPQQGFAGTTQDVAIYRAFVSLK